MNKIRKRTLPLMLIFVSFALRECTCETIGKDVLALVQSAPSAPLEALQTEIAAEDFATQTEAARLKAEAAKLITPTPTSTPTATATAIPTPTPQLVTLTVKVGEVAEFKTFNVIVTEAEYVTPNPKGAYIITVSLENKTSTDLTYSINNFSVTNSAGKNKVLALPKPQGSTWADDFLPNSSVPAGAKSTLQLLAQVLSGLEKDFVLGVNFGNFTALIPLGR